MKTATWNGKVIAEANDEDTIYIEGNIYFPPDSIKKEFFIDSDLTTECHWKGTASYFDLSDSDKTDKNVAWTYNDPLPTAEQRVKKDIRGFVAFYPQVQVS